VPIKPRTATGLLLILLVLAAAWLAWRGPARALQGGSYDFKLIYSGARAWLLGSDPYALEAVQRTWVESGGRAGDPALERPRSSLVYAPPTFVLLSPFAAIDWPAAGHVWLVFNLGLLVFVMWGVARLAGLEGRARLGLWAGTLLLAPVATGMFVGQLALLTLALVVAGELLRAGRVAGSRPGGGSFASGALLGTAAVLKPQLGLLFLVYEAGRLRWKSCLGAMGAIAVLAAIGSVRLSAAGVNWMPQWREHVRMFGLEDGDPTAANPFRTQLLNLAYPVHTIIEHRDAGMLAVYGMLGALSLAYFAVDLRRGRQRGEDRAELLSLSMVAAVTLLIAYHRFYDAVLLVFPLAAAIQGCVQAREAGTSRPSRAEYAVLLLLLLPFLAPGSVVLTVAEQRGWAPRGLVDTVLWRSVMVPHATWALLLMCGWLVWLRSRTRPQSMP
jgi:hypothetical protein